MRQLIILSSCHIDVTESYNGNGHILGLGSPDQLMLSWTFSLVSGLPGRQVDTREWRWWMMMILSFKSFNILKCENSVASLHTLLRTLGGTSGGSARCQEPTEPSLLWHSRSGENQLVLSQCSGPVCQSVPAKFVLFINISSPACLWSRLQTILLRNRTIIKCRIHQRRLKTIKRQKSQSIYLWASVRNSFQLWPFVSFHCWCLVIRDIRDYFERNTIWSGSVQ